MVMYIMIIISGFALILTLFIRNIDWIQRLYYMVFNTVLALLISTVFFYYELLSSFLPYYILGFITLIAVKVVIHYYYQKYNYVLNDAIIPIILNTFILTIAINSLLLNVFRRLTERTLVIQIVYLMLTLVLFMGFRWLYPKVSRNAKLMLMSITIVIILGMLVTHESHTISTQTYTKTNNLLYRHIALDKLGSITINHSAFEALYATQGNEEYFYYVIGPKDIQNVLDIPMQLYAYHYESNQLELIYMTELDDHFRQNFIDFSRNQDTIYMNTQSGLFMLDGATLITLYTHTVHMDSYELEDFYGTFVLEDDILYYDTLDALYKIKAHDLVLVDYEIEPYGLETEHFIFRFSYLGMRYDVFEFDSEAHQYRYHFRRMIPSQITAFSNSLLTINHLTFSYFYQYHIPISGGYIDGEYATIRYRNCGIIAEMDYDYYVGFPQYCAFTLYDNQESITMFLLLDYDRNALVHEAEFYTFKRAEPVINPYFVTIYTTNFYYGLFFIFVPLVKKQN